MLQHKLIRTYRYAESGPPSELTPDYYVRDQPIYKGWAVLQPKVPGVEGRCTVFSRGENNYVVGGIIGNAEEVAAADVSTNAYVDLPADEAEKRRRSDALAAQVADQGVDADIYITRREYLMHADWVTRSATICTPEEALTIIGLYLRLQSEYIVAQIGNDQLRMNRGMFIWVGTRELLPEAWRWFAACVQHSSGAGAGDDRLGYLGQSLLQRFSRALEARDRVHLGDC